LSHRGLAPSRPPAFAPKGSLDGWPRCKTMTLGGMAGPARIRAEASHCAKIGHFYFATTRFVRSFHSERLRRPRASSAFSGYAITRNFSYFKRFLTHLSIPPFLRPVYVPATAPYPVGTGNAAMRAPCSPKAALSDDSPPVAASSRSTAHPVVTSPLLRPPDAYGSSALMSPPLRGKVHMATDNAHYEDPK
jgi:hypothetical protein